MMQHKRSHGYTRRRPCRCAAAWLAVALACFAAAAPAHAQEPAAPAQPSAVTLTFEEALDSAAGAIAALETGGARCVVAAPSGGSLLEPYVARMLARRLAQKGMSVRYADVPARAKGGESGAPGAALLAEARAAGDRLLVCAETTVESGQRYLAATAYDVSTGEQRTRTSDPCFLPERLTALLTREKAEPTSADRDWLELFRRLFSVQNDPARAAQPALTAECTEADFMFENGVWDQAADLLLKSDPPPISRTFMLGVFSLQAAGQTERAASLVESALRTRPDSGPLWTLRAWLSLRMKKNGEAVMWLEQARLCDMAREGYYWCAGGLMALERGDDTAARQALSRAAELLPADASAQSRMARFCLNRGDLEKAVEYYRRATSAPGATSDLWGEMAVALEARGEVDEAVAALQAAFALDSSNLVTTRHLATLLRRQGRTEDSLDVLHRAAAANPRKPDILAAYGDGAAEVWRVDEAVRAFEEAIAAGGPFPYGQTRLAAMCQRRREYARARTLLEDVLRTRPDYHAARVQLGRLLSELGRTEEAVSAVREAMRSPDHEVPARLALVEIHLAANQVLDAVASAQIVAAAQPSADTYAALSKAFLASNDLEKAEVSASTALARAPSASSAHLAMSRVHLARGRAEDALREAEQAQKADPCSVDALEAAGTAAARLGDHRLCAEMWRRALTLNPWHARLHRRLADVLTEKLGDWTGGEKHYRRYIELEKLRADAAR